MSGHVFRRGSSWSYKFDGPSDPITGRRRQLSKGGYADENAALRAMVKAHTEVGQGIHAKPSRLTVSGFLEIWLAGMEEAVKPTTLRSYQDYIAAYVTPHIGHRKLQDIDVPTVNMLYRLLRDSGRRKSDVNSLMYAVYCAEVEAGQRVDPRKIATEAGASLHAARAAVRRFRDGRTPSAPGSGLAPKTIKNVHRMLHRAFGDAVAWRYIAFNPVAHAVPPRGRSPRPKPWTADQLLQFLEAARPDRFYGMWVLAATTGMRRSELAHVDRDGLDLAKGLLEIDLTRVVVAGRAQESDGKTENSRRAISLDTLTIDALEAHLAMLDHEREAFGDAYPGHGLLFVYPDGRPLHPDTITARFNRLVDRARLPRIRLHDVRIHTPPCRWTQV